MFDSSIWPCITANFSTHQCIVPYRDHDGNTRGIPNNLNSCWTNFYFNTPFKKNNRTLMIYLNILIYLNVLIFFYCFIMTYTLNLSMYSNIFHLLYVLFRFVLVLNAIYFFLLDVCNLTKLIELHLNSCIYCNCVLSVFYFNFYWIGIICWCA